MRSNTPIALDKYRTLGRTIMLEIKRAIERELKGDRPQVIFKYSVL
ncbi:hypothetical protein [Microcoleus vaginatus]